MFWNYPLIKYFVEVCTYITLTVITRNPQVWSRWLLFRHLSVSEHLFTSGAFTTSAMVVVWWCVHHARVKSASVYSPTVRLVYCSVADEQRRASRLFVFEFRSPSHWNPHVTANTFFSSIENGMAYVLTQYYVAADCWLWRQRDYVRWLTWSWLLRRLTVLYSWPPAMYC